MRFLKSGLSLRLRATGITLGITTIALTLMAATGIVQIREWSDSEQHRSADAVALGVARAAELPMMVSDKHELSRIANSFLRDQNVLFIAIYGPAGQHVTEAVRDHESWDYFLRGRADFSRCVIGISQIERGGGDEFGAQAEVDPFANPLAEDSKRPDKATKPPLLGRIFVGISTAHSVDAQMHHSRVMAMAAAAAGVVTAGVLFLIFGPWMRRLRRLTNASDSLLRGELGATVGDHCDDEIGKLARSFDEMSVALQERDQKLRRFTDTLQEQVKQRTSDLEAALSAAEEANRAKSLFLANMSHELRTPLNGVIGMVDLLLASETSAQQRRYCDVAKSSGRALLELINDILDFSKIEAGKLELDDTEFNLHEMVEGVALMLGERAATKKLELVCGVGAGVPTMARGDAVRLRQIIVNLTSNAVKFTERGEVVLEAALESETATHSMLRFSVRDTGCGIPADRVGRLFQSFSQVDASTTRKFGGTGLGLAISRRLAEMMGGRIGVESAEGQGSKFWFTARLEKCLQTGAPKRETSLNLRGLRALAVDDNQTNREILHAQLASWSFQADIAGDAGEAMGRLLRAAQENKPYRFAILDMHMPGTDGMELAKRIKAEPMTRDVVLISLSSISDTLRPNELTAFGFAASLTKPALSSQLYNTIVDALSSNETCSTLASGTEERRVPDGGIPRLNGVTILLAEDNEVNRLVASELLLQAGCNVTMVVNGLEAVNAALAGEFDAILMDCQMPELDGFEATGSIREAEKSAGSRRRVIIALTANAIKGDREKCIAAGMDGYVTKPIDPIELMRVIRSFLSESQLQEIHKASAAAESAAVPSPPIAVARIQNASSPIDIVTLQKRCMGNKKLAAKALGKFGSSLANDVESLSTSVKAGDAKKVAAAAHKIKGAAANVSAEDVRRIAAELEDLAKTDDLTNVQTSLDRLAHEMTRFQEYLATALGDLAPTSTHGS